ncbi:hypothetical protein ABPG73_019070 [Tetrahymena malaccensis]
MQRFIYLQLLLFIRCLNGQYDWSFNLTCDCTSASSANYNDNCAWITSGCDKYNYNNNSNYCCVDLKNCYDVTSQFVTIGGFQGGRCLTNQNYFFLCYQFNLLQINLSNWVITLYSGDLLDSSTNPVCQLQDQGTSITCIGYRDLPLNSHNGLSGNSKICINGENDNQKAVTCADNYCINQQENNKCNLFNSQMKTLYQQYGIIGVSGTQRNCITQSQKVNSQNDCSHLQVDSLCFNPADNTCWDLSKLTILDPSQPIGKFATDGTCVFLGVYSNNKIQYCNQNINSVCLDSTIQNQYGCFLWDTHQISQNNKEIIGVFSDGTCAYKDVYDSKTIKQCNTQNTDVCIYNSSLNSNLQGCISWNLSTLTQSFQPIGIFSNYNCAIQNVYQKQKIINCNFDIDGICLDNTSQDNQACLNWNMSSLDSQITNQAIGVFADKSCAFLDTYQNKIIQSCNQQINNICLDKTAQNNQGCIRWYLTASSVVNSQTQVVGVFSDYSCAFLNTYAQKSILQWNTKVANVCIDNRDQNDQAIFWWKDSSNPSYPIGIFEDGSCAYLNTFANKKIQNCDTQKNICIYNSNINNNQQGCFQWDSSAQPQNYDPIGIYGDNTCAIQNIYSNQQIKACNFNIQGICLDNTQTDNQACLNWNMSLLDSSISKQAVGIYEDNSCAFLDNQQNKNILRCNILINNICLDKTTQSNQGCLSWQLASIINSQNQVIGIYSDYTCSYLNTYAQKSILLWNTQIANVCLDNRVINNQAVFWWKDSSDPTFPIGIYEDGSCAYLNIFANKKIKNCDTQKDICIYNSNINNNQQGCFQWDSPTQPFNLYPIGIYGDNSCAIQNIYSNQQIKACNFNIQGICLDNTDTNNQACLNWNMSLLDSSISKQAVVTKIFIIELNQNLEYTLPNFLIIIQKGIYEDNSCAFLNNQQNKNILSCNKLINNICLDKTTQSKQGCLAWQLASITNSQSQVIVEIFICIFIQVIYILFYQKKGMFSDYTCSYLNTYAQKSILLWNTQVANICLDNRVLNNQAVFWWKDSSDPTFPIGIYEDGSCAYLNIFANKKIKNCDTQKDICIYNSNINNNQQGCFQWDSPTQPFNLYPIGIYGDNSCAIQNIYSNQQIKACNFNIQGICLDNTDTNNQACLNWNMSLLDSSISKQAVGIYEDNSCAFLNNQQNKNILSCNKLINNICLDKTTQSKQGCLAWQLASITNSQSQIIGIYSDYSCSYLNTYAQKSILQYNTQVQSVCLDNRNQNNEAVFWWYDSSDPNYPIGIFEDGSCAYLNVFVQNKIKDCNTQNNVCKYNSSVNNNQQGCIQWNQNQLLQSYSPIGIYTDNSCAIINIYDNQQIKQCNYSVYGICVDNTQLTKQACLNWNMSSFDLSITKQAVGIYQNNSCAFVDEYQNQQIKYCNQQIGNICMDNTQTKQACLNWQRPIQSVVNSKTQVIGIFNDYNCAFLNSYASKSILNWNIQVNSVCIDNRILNNEAAFWWDINSLSPQDQTKPIGRYEDGSCAYLNIFVQKQIKFCSQQIQFICLNRFDASYQGCSEWDISPQTIQYNQNLIVISEIQKIIKSFLQTQGRYVDGTCAFVGVYQNNQIQICNFSLDFICKDTSSFSQACVNYQVKFNQIVGADKDYNCLIENQAIAVKCSKSYCIDTNQSCRILSSDTSLNRIMTQSGNYKCFGSVGDTDASKNAIWCATGYCRKGRSNADGSFYCKNLGDADSSCKDDGTHICIPQGGSSNQIIVDMALNYCSAYENNQYMCVNADSDPEYVIKDTNGQCQKLTDQQKSDCKDTTKCFSKITAMYCGCYNPSDSRSQCSFGPLCLDSSQNCVHVDYSELSGFPARKLGTSTCQKDQVSQSVLCSKNYCLQNQECFQMTQNLYISQENKTYQCLQVEQSGQYGAKWCINGFCKIINNLLSIDYCVKMQDQNTFALDKNGRCLSQSQTHNNQDLFSCQMNMFCLDPNSPTPSCIPIDPLNTCVDSNNKCISINSGQCAFCYITQCLSGNQCIPIEDSYCLGYNGRCIQSTTTSICKACNQNECYNPNYYTCTPFINMNVHQDQCLIQVQNYLPCQYKQLNDNQYCAAYDNQCKVLSTLPKCLRCPQTYLWVGTQTCYSSLMIEQISNQNQSKGDTIFTISLIYKQLDITPLKQQCSQGCQLCSSINNCLQCSFEYFLYEDLDLQYQYCILLPPRQIQYPDYLFEDKQFIQYNNNPQIAGIYNLYDYYISQQTNNLQQVYANCLNKWQLVTVGDIVVCDTFNIQYQFIQQKLQIPQLTVYYQVLQNQQNQIVLQQLSSYCNIDNCVGCQIINNRKICQTCQYKYTLNYLNQCEPCPDNCLNCFYGGYYNQQSVNWSQILADGNQGNIDFSLLNTDQYRILCSLCSSKYVVTKDYKQCETCGNNCQQCYQGNLRYNLTSTFDIPLSQKQSSSIIKKCVQCSDGFIISPNMVDCVPISQNCLVEYFGKSDGSRQSFTSQNWWDTSISYEAKCYACSSLVSINLGNSPYQCNNKGDSNYILNCLNTVKFNSEQKPYCISCVQKLSFNKNIQTCDVDCSKEIDSCVGCYSYTDNLNNEIFQCTQCLSKDSNIFLFPTFFGCQQCPEGCSSCYQSEMVNESISQLELKNRTNQIIFEQIQPSLKDRLNIQSSDNYEIICSSCQVGYFLQNKRCVKSQCGPSCDLCYMKNFNPICISCSYTNLLKQISDIQVQIQSFYQLTDLNLKYLTHFNSHKQDCSLCPLGCLSCDQNSITSNPFSLYRAKCYSCKSLKQLTQQIDMANLKSLEQNYEWKLDQDTNSCTLCKNNQQKCAYRKETAIYAKCLDIIEVLGSGTLQKPLNLQRASEAKWDKMIVNESEYQKALVYMNELGLRELQVDVHILDKKCVLQHPISITTSLLQLIPNLQVFQINIIGNYTQDPKNPQISEVNFQDSISINGFLNVQFHNLNFSQTANLQTSQNIIINNTDTNSFQLNNCSISGIFNQFYDIQPIQFNNTKLYQGFFSNEVNSIKHLFFNFQILNLRKTVQITNSSVNNLFIYKSSLFNFINSQKSSQAQNISLQIENFNVSKVYFQESSIISISYFNITFQANNIKLNDNLMIQKSKIFKITPLGNLPIASLMISNFKFQRNQVYQNSQLLIMTQLVYNLFEFITFESNIVRNDQEFSGLVVVNQMVCLKLSVVNNILTKSYLFQNFDDGSLMRQLYMKDQYYLFQFNQVQIMNNTIQLIQSSIFYYVGNSTELNSLKLYGITINQQNQQDINLNSNLFSIKSCYKVAIANVNISHPNQINIFQIQQTQFYTSRGINIVNNWQEEQLKNQLFSIFQIYREINIQAVNIQNITTTSPLIYIMNDFVSYQGDQSVISVNFVNANNNQIRIQQSTNIFSLLAIKTTSVQKISISNLNFQNNTALFDQNQVVNDQQSACSCVCIDAYQSYVYIVQSRFINNYSTASRNVISIISNNANLTDCYFSNLLQKNINTSITHGGLVFSKSSRLSLDSCFLQKGFAQKGGAVYFQGQQYSQIIIAQTQILQSRAALLEPNSLGGGVYVDTTSINDVDIILENSEISNNLATIQGGAFYISPFQGNVFFQISNSVMQNNFALQGAFFDLIFNGNGIGRVFIISSSFYNDPSVQLNDLMQIIHQVKNTNNQLLTFSLFDFTHVTQLYIVGSTFESAQNQINMQTQDKKILLFLYPALFRIFQNTNYNEYNNTYKNFIASQNFINIQTKTLQIVQSQFYNIQQFNLTNVDNLILYNSNFVVIKNSSFSQLQCEFCQISAVKILTLQFQLSYSSFQLNQGSSLGGFLLIQQQNQNQIQINRQLLIEENYQNKIVNCVFQQNTAFNGGSLTIQFYQDFSTIVQGCQFMQNEALNKGGVFYYQQLQQNQQINIIFIKNIFVKNSAKIGAIFYSNINQYMNPISNQNVVSSNQASYFGSMQISSPSQMQIMYKQALYQNNSKILVQTSGYLQNELLVFTLDEQGQQYKELEGDNLYLKVKQVSQIQNAFMEETEIPFQNGNFNLTKYLNIYGKVNETLTVLLTFDRIKIQNSDNYNLVINFQFDQDCQSGYFKTKILNIYDGCLPCKNNSFSLIQNSQVCSSCPKIDGFYCYLETYQQPNGYWRRESQSYNTIECYNSLSNCIGDTQGQQIQRYQLNLLKINISSQEVYFCAEGHLGALCEDCDILGQYWKQKYYKILHYECQSCQVAYKNLKFTMNYILAAIGLNLILLYSFKKTNIDLFLNKIYLQIQLKKKAEISDSFIILKPIINYIQIIGLIQSINTSFLGSNFQIIQFLFNPVYGFVFLFDCQISDFYQKYSEKMDFYIFFRIIFAQILLVILYCLTVLLSTIFICFNKPWISYFRGLINCLIIIIVINITGILTLILEFIFCIEIDGIYYLKRYTRIQCDKKFQDNVAIFLMPMLIFWALLIPLIMILILKKQKIYLNQFQLKCKLGFIFIEYKLQYFYWEIVKIANKLVVLAAVCLTDNSGIQFGLSLASILSYKFILQSVQPYQNKKSCEFEKIMTNSLILCTILIFASLQQEKISTFCFVVFLLWRLLASSVIILVKKQKIGFIQKGQQYEAESLIQNTIQQLKQKYNNHKIWNSQKIVNQQYRQSKMRTEEKQIISQKNLLF